VKKKSEKKGAGEKICILVPLRYPVGGIRTYLKYTYLQLDNKKYKFLFVSPDLRWLKLVQEDLSTHSISISGTNQKNEHIGLALSLLKILKNYEIDVIHSQGYSAGVITCILNLFFRIPHIVTLHHVFNADQFSDTFWKTFPWLKRIIIGNLLKTASRIQPVSNDAKQNLLETFPSLKAIDNRVVSILNGIDVAAFIKGEDNGKLLPFSQDTLKLGFLGRFMPEKGFQYVIEVVDSLVNLHGFKDCVVIVIGKQGGFVREYKKLIKKLGLSQYFHYYGFTKNVYEAIKQIDIVLIPSLGEACPLVPMEALIAGIPVVAFSCIGLREVLSDTPAIMVPVKDTSSMAQAILNVKNDYLNYKNKFDKFKQIACQKYNSKKTSLRLEKLIADIIALK